MCVACWLCNANKRYRRKTLADSDNDHDEDCRPMRRISAIARRNKKPYLHVAERCSRLKRPCERFAVGRSGALRQYQQQQCGGSNVQFPSSNFELVVFHVSCLLLTMIVSVYLLLLLDMSVCSPLAGYIDRSIKANHFSRCYCYCC